MFSFSQKPGLRRICRLCPAFHECRKILGRKEGERNLQDSQSRAYFPNISNFQVCVSGLRYKRKGKNAGFYLYSLKVPHLQRGPSERTPPSSVVCGPAIPPEPLRNERLLTPSQSYPIRISEGGLRHKVLGYLHINARSRTGVAHRVVFRWWESASPGTWEKCRYSPAPDLRNSRSQTLQKILTYTEVLKPLV